MPFPYTFPFPFDSDISLAPGSVDFGVVGAGMIYDTGLDGFSVTNDSGFDVDIFIRGTDMTGGIAWALANDAVPGLDIVGIKAGLEGGSFNIIVKKTAPYNALVLSLPNGNTQKFGLQLLAPTGLSDGVAKTGTVTIAGMAS